MKLEVWLLQVVWPHMYHGTVLKHIFLHHIHTSSQGKNKGDFKSYVPLPCLRNLMSVRRMRTASELCILRNRIHLRFLVITVVTMETDNSLNSVSISVCQALWYLTSQVNLHSSMISYYTRLWNSQPKACIQEIEKLEF